jgi:hypothetical protein
MADGRLIQPDKSIEKMNKLQLMRFVSKIDPTKHFYPKTTLAGRKQAKNIYQKYVVATVCKHPRIVLSQWVQHTAFI